MATESSPHVPLSLTYYWVRHGETEANRAGILQGQSDFPLTESGKEGAIKTGVYLSKVSFDHLYASDLGRATKTAMMILDENYQHSARQRQLEQGTITNSNSDSSLHLKTVPLVREKYYGVKENMHRNCSWEEAAKLAAEQRGITIEKALQDKEEPLELLLKRTQEFLDLCRDDVMKSVRDSDDLTGSKIERNILCVSHSGFISNFLRNLSHFGNQNRDISFDGRLQNCSCNCVRLEYATLSQEKPVIYIDNSLVNLHEHLVHAEQYRQLWPVLDPSIIKDTLDC